MNLLHNGVGNRLIGNISKRKMEEMMKHLKKGQNKISLGKILATMALAIATVTANSTCALWVYEDKGCQELKELRRF